MLTWVCLCVLCIFVCVWFYYDCVCMCFVDGNGLFVFFFFAFGGEHWNWNCVKINYMSVTYPFQKWMQHFTGKSCKTLYDSICNTMLNLISICFNFDVNVLNSKFVETKWSIISGVGGGAAAAEWSHDKYTTKQNRKKLFILLFAAIFLLLLCLHDISMGLVLFIFKFFSPSVLLIRG